MTPTQAENLRILIRHMETACHRTLDMSHWGSCGTPACAAGEAIGVPQLIARGLGGEGFSPQFAERGGMEALGEFSAYRYDSSPPRASMHGSETK